MEIGCSDLLVFSHLRWDFVFQRPQHLLTRFAKACRVFYVEEPWIEGTEPELKVMIRDQGVLRVVPHLPAGMTEEEGLRVQKGLLEDLYARYRINDCALWYYTPMALPLAEALDPRAIAYDCMDELSLFKNAHPRMGELEAELLRRSDVVFTGGYHLYEHKRSRHPNIHPFPSGIDFGHFARARAMSRDQAPDQAGIPGPRIGFYGVIDDRLDFGLIRGVAEARPDWSLVILGPVANKVSEEDLPRLPNIHYLGQKDYLDLPTYLAGWDVAMMPFAHCDATRFISPTKTPEFLAAGKPVVSTSIRDVVRPYGEEGLVLVADRAAPFVQAIEEALAMSEDAAWIERRDRFLSDKSWDRTWLGMGRLLADAVERRRPGRQDTVPA